MASPRVLIYTAHWGVMSALLLLLANVQVTTRIVGAGCPPVYWYTAHLLRDDEPGAPKRGWRPLVRSSLRFYVAAYWTCGIILHSNSFPWT